MMENKINAVLYIILAAVLLLYLHINVFLVRQTSIASSGEYADGRLTKAELNKNGLKENELKKNGLNEMELREDESSIELKDKLPEETLNISQNGYHIFVDLDLTRMYLYKDGELMKTYEVSGGKRSTPSPTGTWKIIHKDTWGEGFGGAWLGFNVPWGMYGIHGTTEPWSVGNTNTSKGCIRMKNADVRELYKLVPYNTIVTIVHKNRPFYPMMDGDVGSDILEVEKALKKLGYYKGSEDGIFGETLKAAVREFQKDNRLYKTGVVNISTYELIMQLVKDVEE